MCSRETTKTQTVVEIQASRALLNTSSSSRTTWVTNSKCVRRHQVYIIKNSTTNPAAAVRKFFKWAPRRAPGPAAGWRGYSLSQLRPLGSTGFNPPSHRTTSATARAWWTSSSRLTTSNSSNRTSTRTATPSGSTSRQ